MAETDQFSPESGGGTFPFKVGEEDFGFNGGFTEGKFTGMIRGADGKDFAGIVEDLGNGRYRIEDWESGRMFEPPSEQMVLPAADVAPGLEDAAAVAAMDGAPVEAATRAEPQPVQAEPAAETAETTAELPLTVEPEPAAAEEPAAEAGQPPVPEPAAEEVPVEQAEVELPAPAPEPEAVPVVGLAGMPEKAPKENRHPLIVELQQKMQGVYRPFQAARLWKQAEVVRDGVNKTKSQKRIEQSLAEEGKLKRQAKELHPGIEKMTETEREKLSLESVPLSAEGVREAIPISSPRHRENMAVFYDTELQKWESTLRNPADFEQYRTAAAEIESKKNEARKLFSAERDGKLLNKAIAQIDQTGSGQLKELGTRLPQRLLELAGFIHSEPPTLGQAKSDVDLRLAYNRAAEELYAELAGQPQAAAEAVTVPMPEPESESALEPVLSPEEITPVIEATAEQAPVVEGAVLPDPEPAAEEAPQPETEEAPPVEMKENPAEVDLPITSEGEAVPAAVEVEGAPDPIEAPLPEDQGKVVVDAEEQARVAGMPVAMPVESAPLEQVSDDEAVEWLESLRSPTTAPMPEEPAPPAGVPVMAQAEAPAQPEVELTPDQIRERAENRKNSFASAVAQLEGAYMDTAGTKNERVGRVVEGVRKMMLAGLELAEEGGAAQEVVMNVLGRLNNEQNRPLVQAAAGQAPEQVERAVGEMLQARGAFGPDGKPKSRKELENAGLVGLIELLLELGMSFTDASVNAVITEVQSATGAGR